MANKKINELVTRTPSLSDLILVGDPSSGYSYKATVTALATIIETDIADGFVTLSTTQTISGAKTFSNNLTLTSVANAATTQTKFLTLNASNVVNYRTGAEVLADIGGQGTLTLTTTGTSGAATLVGNTLNIPQYTDQYVGTVTSVAMTVPTGLTVSGTPITSSGTLAVSLQSGYSIPTTASQANWDSAYNDKINSAAVTGTTTKTLTLTQQDGGTVTASWTDDNTDAVTSVFGRTGAVVATEGDYSLTQLSDVTITSPSNGQVLKYNGTTWVNDTDANTGTVTSVGLSAPTGFSVTNSPVTSSGTLTLSFASGYSLPTTASQTNWDTAYTNRITSLTTTGSSGAATLVSNTLNIPNYTLAGLGGISGSGTTNYIPKFTSSSAIGNSIVQDYGDNVWVGTNAAGYGTLNIQRFVSSPYATLTLTDQATPSNEVGIYLRANGSNPVGISSAGAPIAFYTGGPATNERMRLTSGGLLGIGTSAPDRKLVIQGAFNSNEQLLYLKQGDNNGFSFNLDAAVTGNLMIKGVNSGTETSSLLTIRRDNGNTGIGTSAPAEKLDVYDNSASNVSIKVGNTSGALQLLQGNGAAYLYTATNQPLIFSNNNSEKMRLDASGNLGLGTSSPAYKLDVSGSGRFYGSSAGGNVSGVIVDNTAGGVGVNTASLDFANGGSVKASIKGAVYGNGYMTFSTNDNTEKMRLDASGNLGLGVTPSAWYSTGYSALQVRGAALYSANGNDVNITSNAYLSTSPAWTYTTSSTATRYEQGAGAHKWYTAPSGTAGNAISFTQAMTLDASGRLGIGTSSPTYKLVISNGGALGFEIDPTSSSGGIVSLLTYDRSAGSYKPLQINSEDIRFQTGTVSTEKMRITSGGSVGIGTSSPTEGKLVVANSGPSIIYNKETSVGVNSFWNASDGSIVQFGVASNHPLIMLTNNTERMRITSGGEVLVGSTSSGLSSSGRGVIEINGTSESILGLKVNNVVKTYLYQSGDNVEFNNTANGYLALKTNASERMRITSGGDVAINTTTANSKLHVAGSLRLPLVTKSATYTLDATDYTVGFDCTGANRTANLPDATTCSGRIYVIYQFGGGSTYGVTIDGNSSQTINGSATYVLQGYCDYSSVMIQSDGSNWVVISDALQTGCL